MLHHPGLLVHIICQQLKSAPAWKQLTQDLSYIEVKGDEGGNMNAK